MITLQPVLILIVIFGAIVAIVYISAKKKERMIMIERGMDPKSFQQDIKSRELSLKYGILLLGLGTGILMGKLLSNTIFIEEPEAAYFSMIFLFGGASLILHYIISKNQKNNDNDSIQK